MATEAKLTKWEVLVPLITCGTCGRSIKPLELYVVLRVVTPPPTATTREYTHCLRCAHASSLVRDAVALPGSSEPADGPTETR